MQDWTTTGRNGVKRKREKEEEKDEKDIGYNFITQSIICFIFCY